jgi:hypothetical protein
MKTTLALSFALAILAGCSGSPVPASKPAALPAAAAAPTPTPAAPPGPAAPGPANPGLSTALVPTAPEVSSPVVFHYEPKGRRDPFEALELKADKTALAVTTAKLTGIVRNPSSSMALIETQDGIGYILKPGDTLFDGRLVHIGVDSVVFAVASQPGSTTNQVVLKLAAN